MNIADMRQLVRRDLHDEEATDYRWTDAELDRHVQHAVRELSLSVPLQATASLVTTDGSRDVSLRTLADLIRVEAAEFPAGRYPPAYVRFSVWGDNLTLHVDAAPSGGEAVRLYYLKLHTLDAIASTIPAHLEELAAMGAGGYAALEWASFATNRVNVGGPQAWRHFLVWGKERLRLFHAALARLSATNAVRTRQLYVPTGAGPAQAGDRGAS